MILPCINYGKKNSCDDHMTVCFAVLDVTNTEPKSWRSHRRLLYLADPQLSQRSPAASPSSSHPPTSTSNETDCSTFTRKRHAKSASE